MFPGGTFHTTRTLLQDAFINTSLKRGGCGAGGLLKQFQLFLAKLRPSALHLSFAIPEVDTRLTFL